MIDLILDTDIGTDVDDSLALALVLQSPELRLLGVTCSYGDVGLRARMTERLLALHSVRSGSIPVHLGEAVPLEGAPPVYWAGHEGKALLPEAGEPDEFPYLAQAGPTGRDVISATVRRRPGVVTLVAIGPLTTVAQAISRDPALARGLARLVIMGGAVRPTHDPGGALTPEHNVASDPQAARTVLTSGARITLVPLDVTQTVRIGPEGVAAIADGGSPFHSALAALVDTYPPYRRHGFTHLHDPLAVATMLWPELVDMAPMRLDVDEAGVTHVVADGGRHLPLVDVVTGVRHAEVATRIVDRLAGPVPHDG